MISQTKKIRTKKGDPMMFATLDDLEGSVELLIFGKPLAASEDAAVADTIVLVRGRVDHKDRDKTCVIVQQIDRFEPTAEEVQEAAEQAAKLSVRPSALVLRLDATALGPMALVDLKELVVRYPGDADVVVEVATSGGPRRLRLGAEFRVARSAALYAELETLLGGAMLAAEDRADEQPRVAASA